MKKYKVDIWSEETYKKVFEANSEEEAEEMAREEIDEGDGVDFKANSEEEAIKIFEEQGYNDDQVHREKFIDYQFCEIEEVA